MIIFGCRSSHTSVANKSPWYTQLPGCPCLNPDLNGVVLGDGWAKDATNLDKYHKGAVASFRSYPALKTSAGKSGQQCCYDSTGKLITHGSGAGTPDKSGSCNGEKRNGMMKVNFLRLFLHYFKDVRPWQKMGGSKSGWVKYNELWVPQMGNGCK